MTGIAAVFCIIVLLLMLACAGVCLVRMRRSGPGRPPARECCGRRGPGAEGGGGSPGRA